MVNMEKKASRKRQRSSSSSSETSVNRSSGGKSDESDDERSETEGTNGQITLYNNTSSSAPTTPQKNLKPLQTFIKDNSLISQNVLNIDDLDSFEISLLQIPKTINPQVLEGLDISLTSKTKFKRDRKKFVVKPNGVPEKIAILGNRMKVISPVSSLILERNIKETGQPTVEVTERENVTLPENLKVRHPIFGVDYKKHLNLDDRIKEKLENAVNNKLKVKRKKKNKKNKSNEEETDFLNELNNLFNHKERRRSKSYTSESEAIIKQEVNEEGKKKKRKKAIVENGEIIKIKKEKSDNEKGNNTESLELLSEFASAVENNKAKRKSKIKEENTGQLLNGEVIKRKKNKRQNGELKESPIDWLDVIVKDEEVEAEKKKKRKSRLVGEAS